jgi:Ca2+-transporting ATPase
MAIVLYSLAMTIAVMVAIIYSQKITHVNDEVLNNIAFITLAFAQLFHVFNMSSFHSKLLVNEITRNKFVWFAVFICSGLMIFIYILPQTRLVLGLVELPLEVWSVSIMASLIPLVVVQIYKGIMGKRN